MSRLCLCVNQVARVRNFNRKKEPDPLQVAMAAELAGIDGIVVQLREDRADIDDRDLRLLKEVVKSHLNLAIPLQEVMVQKALQLLPDMVTLLPVLQENEGEEVALNVEANLDYFEEVAAALRAHNIVVSALVAVDPAQIRAAARAGADYVQFNTTLLAGVEDLGSLTEQVERLRAVAAAANKLGLGVAAGRGLGYQNIRDIAAIPLIEEVNIGRAILSRALLIGVDRAIAAMKSQLEHR
ncbi:MAG TPA: pyridoxine 5'-phosphate synthase [bacterium]|nr:pyridoxine 5'-phosphate synthase [bacterium]HQG45092.1 pyridoxine 5'-phosphate synthase [bacterium]HQI47162.1 pyridoxine 5'-phosphate synthase [bacterium]HQJ63539.1 pyridoxine 5'-phosphate synthase [bacterium]